MPTNPHRFAALDGLRFVAAFMVLLFHGTTELELQTVPRGYLAVDFFFVLSGFVVAFAYEERLKRGAYLVAFLRRRFVRLYPLCVLGGVLGYIFHPEGEPTLRDMLLSFVLVPQFHGWLFPVNIPLWSLFFEVVVNIFYGVVLYRLRTRYVGAIFLAVSAYNLYFALGLQNYDAGGYVDDWAFGFVRALQSFAAGVLLYRLRSFKIRLPAITLLPLTVLLCGSTLMAPTDTLSGAWDWATVTIFFPLLVAAGMAVDAGGVLRRALQLGGEVSYPLYLVHFPLLVMLAPAIGSPSQAVKLGTVAAVSLVISMVAVVAYYAYDRPVRRWLTRLIEAGAAALSRARPGHAIQALAKTEGLPLHHHAMVASTDDQFRNMV